MGICFSCFRSNNFNLEEETQSLLNGEHLEATPNEEVNSPYTSIDRTAELKALEGIVKNVERNLIDISNNYTMQEHQDGDVSHVYREVAEISNEKNVLSRRFSMYSLKERSSVIVSDDLGTLLDRSSHSDDEMIYEASSHLHTALQSLTIKDVKGGIVTSLTG